MFMNIDIIADGQSSVYFDYYPSELVLYVKVVANLWKLWISTVFYCSESRIKAIGMSIWVGKAIAKQQMNLIVNGTTTLLQ